MGGDEGGSGLMGKGGRGEEELPIPEVVAIPVHFNSLFEAFVIYIFN